MKLMHCCSRFTRCVALALSFVVFADVSSAQAPAAQSDSLLRRAIQTNASALTLRGDTLGGVGGTLLRERARAARFVLVGEDHGSADIPRFASALLASVADVAPWYVALEAGPLTTRSIETKLRTSRAAYDAWIREYPYLVPFYNWSEDADFLQKAIRLWPARRDIVWGIDYEFIMSPTYFFREAAIRAPRSVPLQRYSAQALDLDKRMVAEGNPGLVFMASTPDSVYDASLAALAATGASGRAAATELSNSRQVFSKQFGGEEFASNIQRAQLMKRRLGARYETALKTEAAPHVFVKIGAFHAMRGRSFTGTYEIGSMLPELAEAHGASAFSVLVIPGGGDINAYRPFMKNLADTSKAYNPKEELSFTDPMPFVAAANAGAWTVIDMRPLRLAQAKNQLGRVPESVTRVIQGFDAVVVIPEIHPAHYITNVPAQDTTRTKTQVRALAASTSGIQAILDAASGETVLQFPGLALGKASATLRSQIQSRYAPSPMTFVVQHVVVSSDGLLGCAIGLTTNRLRVAGDPVQRSGRYVSCWQRAKPESAWRLVVHAQNGETESVHDLEVRLTGAPHSATQAGGGGDSREAFVADSNFAAASLVSGPGPAFARYAADDGLLLGARPRPLRGPLEIEQALGPKTEGNSVSWAPLRNLSVGTGGLALSMGEATHRAGAEEERTKYLSIWRREPDGSWKYVIDLGSPRP